MPETAKSIPLTDWAALRYDPPPSAWTVSKWARNGEIYPPPEKVGKHWYVSADAVRLVSQRPTLLQRLAA